MKMQLKRMVFIGISLMVFSSIGFAEILYVPGRRVPARHQIGIEVKLRAGPSMKSKIIARVKSSTKVEILEPGDDWSRVRHESGLEGYLLTKYLITEERWRQIIEAERKRKEERAEEKKRRALQLVEIYKGVKFSILHKGVPLIILNPFLLIGEVPSNIDLADGGIAKDLLRKGFQLARAKCPNCKQKIEVVLFEGKFKELERFAVRGVFNQKGEFATGWGKPYTNKPEGLAEEKRDKLLAKKRLDNFEKIYGVTDWPVMKEFYANPFIYEGKQVAFVSEFETMLSATEGVFRCSGELFIVSDIPKGFFTKEAEVVIVGRSLGKKGTKLPLVGEVLVPNLKFVGAYFCEKQHCRDIVWK